MRIQKDLNVFLRAFLLVFLICTALMGCQSLDVRTGTNHNYLKVSSDAIAHITDKADIVLTLSQQGDVLDVIHYPQINYIPYTVKLPNNMPLDGVMADIKVIMDGAELMYGITVLSDISANHIELFPAYEKPLTKTVWKAEDISGRGIPSFLETTLTIKENGEWGGFSGCNHYKGHYRTAASLIEANDFVLTRKRCSSPVMFHENRFLKYLKMVEYFSVQNDKLTLFVEGTDKPIVFSAIKSAGQSLSQNAK